MKKNAEILEELKQLKSILGNHEEDIQLFHVPEGYFEQLPVQILNDIKVAQLDTELNLTIDKTGPYNIPFNYFEHLESNILQQIRNIQPIVEGKEQSFDYAAAEATYEIPSDYFATFEQNLFSKLGLQTKNAAEEIETISPLLAGLKDKPSYKAPETYFNAIDFSEKVQGKTIERKVMEHPAVKSIKWARWAAAAAIIMIFSIGGFKFLNPANTVSNEAKYEKMLANIPDAKLKEWLSNNMDETDINSLSASVINSKDQKTQKALDNIRAEDIEDYINN